jgi:hypothetical protein
MLDLFYPPSIKPRATKPDPGAFIGPPTREETKRMLIRMRQSEWLRNKRRNDPGWRERENAIERERYAKASLEKRQLRLAQMMEYKLNRRP